MIVDAIFNPPLERPLVIAHRGFSGRYPENTALAFGKACELGADMIELDVTLTADGKPVVIHDETLDRTTNGSGKVMKHTLSRLQRLEAGAFLDPAFEGEPIPTLTSTFEQLGQESILINVEIKGEAVTNPPPGSSSDALATAVAELVLQHSLEDRVVISSFEPRALEQIREVAPELARASLLNMKVHQGLGPAAIAAQVGSRAFNISQKQASPALIAHSHLVGLPVFVYTVDDPTEMAELLELRVDGIFTNRPDRMIELLG